MQKGGEKEMKKIFTLVLTVVLVFGLTLHVHASSLTDMGDGTIYDDDQNLYWLQDASYAGTSMNWYDAMTWANSLTVGGYTDWRLPTTLQPDPSCDSQSGSVSYGYNCTGSELGNLFYNGGRYCYSFNCVF